MRLKLHRSLTYFSFFLCFGISSVCVAEDFHERIDAAIEAIASTDTARREEAAELLLTAPTTFRQQLVVDYKRQAGTLANSLPQQIDEYTTIDAVLVTDNSIHFNYSVSFDENTLTSEERRNMHNLLTSKNVTQICSNPGAALYLLYSNEIIRSYSFFDGAFFFETRVSWRDCQER